MPPTIIVDLDDKDLSHFSAPTKILAGFIASNPSYIVVLSDICKKCPAEIDYGCFVAAVDSFSSKTFCFGPSKKMDAEFFKFLKAWCKPKNRYRNVNVGLAEVLEYIVNTATRPRYKTPNKHASNTKIAININGAQKLTSGSKELDTVGWQTTKMRGEFYECKFGKGSTEGTAKEKYELLADIKKLLGEGAFAGVVSLLSSAELELCLKGLVGDDKAALIQKVGYDAINSGLLAKSPL